MLTYSYPKYYKLVATWMKNNRFDLSKVMKKAWAIFRKYAITFAEALHRAWQSIKAEPINAARVKLAAYEAGITEEVNTWSAWRDLGYMVNHGSKALFAVNLIYASKGDGEVYRASFFGASQVHAI